jgi:hypothetical protein
MKTFDACILIALVAVSPCVPAQSTPSTQSTSTVTTSPGSGKAVQTIKTTATVVGVNPSTRLISLKRADGQIVEVQAGEEVKNLDKIKVGDIVNVEYTQALSIDLKKGGVGSAHRTESAELNRAPPGGQVAATAGKRVTVLADVIAVDVKNKVITLRGPDDKVVDLKVQDPEQVKRVKKGDQVQAVYTEALAVSVQPAAPSPGKK